MGFLVLVDLIFFAAKEGENGTYLVVNLGSPLNFKVR